MATEGTACLSALIAQANPECVRSANEIPIRAHGFKFPDRGTNLDRADLRARERDHFPEVAGCNTATSTTVVARVSRADRANLRGY